jgi:hypothetical protein
MQARHTSCAEIGAFIDWGKGERTSDQRCLHGSQRDRHRSHFGITQEVLASRRVRIMHGHGTRYSRILSQLVAMAWTTMKLAIPLPDVGPAAKRAEALRP